MDRRRLLAIVVLVGLIAFRPRSVQAVFSATALIDNPSGFFNPGNFNFQLGLYQGTNSLATASPAHAAAAANAAFKVVPLCNNGMPPSGSCAEGGSGKIGFMILGFSNTVQGACSGGNHNAGYIAPANYSQCVKGTFAANVYNAQQGAAPTVDPSVYMIVCAQPGKTTQLWDTPFTNTVWTNCESVVTGANLTDAQVEVILMETATGNPPKGATMAKLNHSPCVAGDEKSVDACANEMHLGNIARAVHTHFPNLQLMYLTSRAYGGWATGGLQPEPFAYEYGFTVQFLIGAQIEQADNGGAENSEAGDLSYDAAPVLLWGPYSWASGTTANSEGTVWPKTDFQMENNPNDTYVHYRLPGYTQIGTLWSNFFAGTSLTGALNTNNTTWFRPQ
ncbi:MAG TPA: hypothetical protein VFB15_13135 [Candidatus Binataceae bacterium]|nr:hypothetical protein [Candidatus Binataceae bacterium]